MRVNSKHKIVHKLENKSMPKIVRFETGPPRLASLGSDTEEELEQEEFQDKPMLNIVQKVIQEDKPMLDNDVKMKEAQHVPDPERKVNQEEMHMLDLV